MDEGYKKLSEEWLNCLAKERKSHREMPLLFGLATFLFYGRSGNIREMLLKKITAGLAGIVLGAVSMNFVSFSNCAVHIDRFLVELPEDERKKAEKIWYTTVKGRPTHHESMTIGDDTPNVTMGVEENKEVTPPRKPSTFDDLYGSYDTILSREPEETMKLKNKPAQTPPAKPVARNKYGDPIG